MQDKPGMFGQPLPNPFMTVRAIVVQNEMQGEFFGKLCIQSTQELKKFLVTMAGITRADDTAFHDVESGKQSGRAVSFIIMRKRAAATRFERQSRLRAIQGLNLAFLIDAEHHGRFVVGSDTRQRHP